MTQRKLSEIAGQKVSQKDLVSLNGGTVLDEIAKVFELNRNDIAFSKSKLAHTNLPGLSSTDQTSGQQLRILKNPQIQAYLDKFKFVDNFDAASSTVRNLQGRGAIVLDSTGRPAGYPRTPPGQMNSDDLRTKIAQGDVPAALDSVVLVDKSDGKIDVEEFSLRLPESSNIQSARYNVVENELDVTFHSGSTYRYFDVQMGTVELWMSASSAGKFHYWNIRMSFKYKRM